MGQLDRVMDDTQLTIGNMEVRMKDEHLQIREMLDKTRSNLDALMQKNSFSVGVQNMLTDAIDEVSESAFAEGEFD